MAPQQAFADTRSLAAGVAESGACFSIYGCQNLGFVFRLRLFRVRIKVRFVLGVGWVRINFRLGLLLTG